VLVNSSVSKAPDRIAGMFDAIAGRYDFLNHFLSAGIDRRWRRRAIDALALRGSERVLDLCTGTGDLALAAIHARPGAARVVGIDFAAAMLRVGRDKLRDAGAQARAALIRGDATRIPLRDGTVDAITLGFGIRNVEDVETACRDMHRVLTPGGRLAILEFAVPTMPGLSAFYLFYLRHVLPKIGRAISRHPAAYDYLPASIDAFATPDQFVKILRHNRFVDVSAISLSFGAVILYTARRDSGDYGPRTGDQRPRL
jgi:demethylmenaquinone methyltransferase/2-methoxy-6-polyprenyl-1,4-benzoquinol methylase